MLRAAGYDAEGIDPNAPEEPHYQSVEFEEAELPQKPDAFVASTSLHHVLDPAIVIDRMTSALDERRRRRRGRVGLGDVRHGNGRMVLRAPRRGRRAGLAASPTRGMARIRPGVADLPAGVGGRPRAASRRDGCAPARRAARAAASRATGRTSSPISPTPPKQTSRRRSTRAGSDRCESTMWAPFASGRLSKTGRSPKVRARAPACRSTCCRLCPTGCGTRRHARGRDPRLRRRPAPRDRRRRLHVARRLRLPADDRRSAPRRGRPHAERRQHPRRPDSPCADDAPRIGDGRRAHRRPAGRRLRRAGEAEHRHAGRRRRLRGHPPAGRAAGPPGPGHRDRRAPPRHARPADPRRRRSCADARAVESRVAVRSIRPRADRLRRRPVALRRVRHSRERRHRRARRRRSPRDTSECPTCGEARPRSTASTARGS